MTDIERIRHMIADRECEIEATRDKIRQYDTICSECVEQIVRWRREIDRLYDQMRRLDAARMNQ